VAQVWCVCGYVLWLRSGPLLLYQCAIHLVPDVQGCRFLTSGMLLVNGSCTASHALQIADVLLLVLNVHDSERKVRCPKTSALCQGTRSAIAETAAFCRCLPGSTARDIRTEPCLAALWPIAELVGEAHEIKFPKTTYGCRDTKERTPAFSVLSPFFRVPAHSKALPLHRDWYSSSLFRCQRTRL